MSRAPAAAAVAIILAAGTSAWAKDGRSGIAPVFEVKGVAGTKERGSAAWLELDGAIPVHAGRDGKSVLFVQPGALLSQQAGGESVYGASTGIVYRFKSAGAIAGLNAFYDRNWIVESGRSRQHAQGSIGADLQAGRNRLGVNWYFPLSETATLNDGPRRVAEYAVGGAELLYRFALDDRWTARGRAFFELDPNRGVDARYSHAKEEAATVLSAGASYRIGCTKIGLDVEHDTASRDTGFLVGVSIRLGGSDAQSCAEEAGGSLVSLVERSKIVRLKRTLLGLIPFTTLPADVTELFAYATTDDATKDANEVWLFSQGGPSEELESGPQLGQFPGSGSRIQVNVHQAQTINPDLFTDERLNSLERIQAEMDVSVEILHRVIRHFKAQGKKVVVFGHSFGAFTVTRYLALKGPAAADRYVIMAGRLDMEQAVVDNRLEYFRDRQSGLTIFRYGNNGEKEIVLDESLIPSEEADRRSQVFQGVVARHRYTRLLSNTDLSKVLYAYGTRDRRTGGLEQAEVDFLKSRGATVHGVSTGESNYQDENGNTVSCVADPERYDGCPGRHGSMFVTPATQNIVNWIEQ